MDRVELQCFVDLYSLIAWDFFYFFTVSWAVLHDFYRVNWNDIPFWCFSSAQTWLLIKKISLHIKCFNTLLNTSLLQTWELVFFLCKVKNIVINSNWLQKWNYNLETSGQVYADLVLGMGWSCLYRCFKFGTWQNSCSAKVSFGWKSHII